jgi:hypothetical protein
MAVSTEPRTGPILLAGRAFRPCTTTTLKQDIYVMRLVRSSGLQALAEGFDITQDTLDGDVAQDILVTAFTHGKLFHLLSAVLYEDGKPWTVKTARQNARFFADLVHPDDKAVMQASIVGILLSFFVNGLVSSMSSHISLSALEVASPEPLSEETTTLMSGTALSENSPVSKSPSIPVSSTPAFERPS